ncbi:hypothetical protein HRR80_007861 [Exophiala dermatitidis]|uniref:Uncharacterized protein n=2 Tax=Exophiala dermatitidis TaxID=5970 RepID=H6BWJ9_EXODN|nr:uncharacterized protein HMPREF1120_03390 [Exophiala dermatitidis NIH/UT8656]EHY55245.1 hypothetical protein HMPREF1120_03390 [Exophiala dermatitidis NIH/UT8656]KAJ8988084.1 hypothetical protein HRR80_007861 [Exophiala dermatitidis]
MSSLTSPFEPNCLVENHNAGLVPRHFSAGIPDVRSLYRQSLDSKDYLQYRVIVQTVTVAMLPEIKTRRTASSIFGHVATSGAIDQEGSDARSRCRMKTRFRGHCRRKTNQPGPGSLTIGMPVTDPTRRFISNNAT